MSKQPARNEGIRPLDDFVCQAIANPAAFSSEAVGPVTRRGKNAGMQVSQELVFDAAAQPYRGGATGVDATREAELRSFSTQQLLALTKGPSNPLRPSELKLIGEIARERLTCHTAEVHLASQLLASCQPSEKGTS